MKPAAVQKHLFHGTLLVLLFLGALSSVFRTDFGGKVVTTVCVFVLFSLSVLNYVRRQRAG